MKSVKFLLIIKLFVSNILVFIKNYKTIKAYQIFY